MKALPLIHTSWLTPFADYFAERGIGLQAYFDQVQIEAARVVSGDGWITKHQLYGFLNLLAKEEQMPEVGFVVGETITPDCLGELGGAMADEETLGGVIRAFCRLINRHVEGNRCWLEEGSKGEVWLFNAKTMPSEDDRSIADHAGLMSMVNLVRLVGGRNWYPGQICLQTGPTVVHHRVPGLRGALMQFDCDAAGFSFPASWLLEPVEVDKGSPPSTVGQPGLLKEGESIVTKLKLLLVQLVGIGGMGPTIGLVADLCGASARTVQRRLDEAGVSYRELLDEVRLERAMTLLKESNLSVKEVAFDLGYSGPNNFIRAFRRLAGCSPGEIQRRERVK